MFCQLKSCHRCHGDLALDGDELRCWQCGHRYYPKGAISDRDEAYESPAEDSVASQRSRRERRNVNKLIVANHRSEERWRIKNQQALTYLAEGRSVREIAALVGQGERQIRAIRERLIEMRDGWTPPAKK